MQYFASGPPDSSLSRSPSSAERSSVEASEAPEAVEAIEGLLENDAAAVAVGNTVDPVVSEVRDELEELGNLLSAAVSINWDGKCANSTSCEKWKNTQIPNMNFRAVSDPQNQEP